MNTSTGIKLFATIKVTGSKPTQEQVEALLDRANQEIELRVRTPFSTTAALEAYAHDLAQAAGLVLISARQADWHKPYVLGGCPFPMGSRWTSWQLEKQEERLNNPRIRIVDKMMIRAIAAAETRTKPKNPEPGNRTNSVPLGKALWVARELPGVSELTLMPTAPSASSGAVHPITATFATPQGKEDCLRGIDLLAAGKKPLEAAREIIGRVSEERWVRNTQRHEAYHAQWVKVCALRGYDPAAQMRACVCRAYELRRKDFAEFVRRWADEVIYKLPHQPECYQRLVDILTYQSDWNLAVARITDEVGERHSLIALYAKKLAKARSKSDHPEQAGETDEG